MLMHVRVFFGYVIHVLSFIKPISICAACRNVLSSQEVVDFISERIKPDQTGKVRALSSIVEEVRW